MTTRPQLRIGDRIHRARHEAYLTNADHMCTLGRMSEPATMLTPPEAAKRLGVHHQTLRRWMRAGTVASVEMPSGRKKVPASEVDRILLGRAS